MPPLMLHLVLVSLDATGIGARKRRRVLRVDCCVVLDVSFRGEFVMRDCVFLPLRFDFYLMNSLFCPLKSQTPTAIVITQQRFKFFKNGAAIKLGDDGKLKF